MYIHKINPDDMFDFLKNQYKHLTLELQRYEKCEDKIVISFNMVEFGKTRLMLAEFSKYKCVVSHAPKEGEYDYGIENVFIKSWAEHMVAIIDNTKDIDVTSEDYKKDYNTHLQEINKATKKQADQNYEANVL